MERIVCTLFSSEGESPRRGYTRVARQHHLSAQLVVLELTDSCINSWLVSYLSVHALHISDAPNSPAAQ